MTERLHCDDVVVVIPGILGSRLSRDGQEVWGASAGAAVRALMTFGRSLKELALPEGIGDGDPEDGVVATGLMNELQIVPGLWSPIRGYSGLLRWLRHSFTLRDADHSAEGEAPNLVAFGYDWRLSNRLTAQRLRDQVEPVLEAWRSAANPDARLVFLCHSMGGLVARRYLQCLGGAAHTRLLMTFGTPHRGSAKALDQLVNGRSQGWWKFRLDLTAMVRSLPSVHQLLPTYACLDAGGPELQRLDELDVPDLDRARVADALAFHEEMAPSHLAPYAFHAITGIEQPTWSSARLAGRELTTVRTMRFLRDGRLEEVDDRGDGTVPRFSAAFTQEPEVDASRVWRTEQHGALHLNDALLDHVRGALTDTTHVFRGPSRPPVWIGLEVPDVATVGAPLELVAESPDDRLALQVVVVAPDGAAQPPVPFRNLGQGRYAARVTLADPGPHLVQAASPLLDANAPPPVTGAVLAWAPELEER